MSRKWIFILVPILLFLLPYLIVKLSQFLINHKTVKPLTAQELHQKALKAGFASNPKTFEELLKLYPAGERPSKELISLGKSLFFDPILSKENSISCAGCHILEDGGDDNRPTAIGYHNQANPFHLNSPTVLNAALQKFQFWDARAKNVEEQAGGPITAPFEMAMTPESVVKKLSDSPYKARFEKLFKDGVTFENAKKAIGAYERTLLTRGRFDKFLDGNLTALSDKERAGFELFMDIGCKACHFGRSVGGQIIQKFPLNRYGNFFYPEFGFKNKEYIFKKIVFQEPQFTPFPFDNVGGFLGKDMSLRFKVPMLRDITRTAPYFHNGVEEKLEKVIEIMAKHQRGLVLDKEQTQKIAAFLKSLEGELVDYGNF